MKKRPNLIVVFVLIFLVYSLINSPKATPDQSILYLFKRVQEKVFMKLELSHAGQAKYMMSLLNQRLYEVQRVVEKQKVGYVLESASRYSTWAGQTTDFVIQQNLSPEIEDLKKQLLAHQQILKKIYEGYPKNTDDVEYKYIEDDINYIDIYLQKLQNTQLPS